MFHNDILRVKGMESHWYYCLQFTSIRLIIQIHFIVLYIFITLFVKMIIRVSENCQCQSYSLLRIST